MQPTSRHCTATLYSSPLRTRGRSKLRTAAAADDGGDEMAEDAIDGVWAG